jgi:hypothetical protein
MAISVRRGITAIPALTNAPSSADRASRIVIPLYFAGVVLATTVVVNIAGLTISADRLVLLAFFIPILSSLGQVRNLRLQAFDYCIFATIAWLVLSLIINNGAERGVKYGGSLAVEAIGGYLLARVYVRNFAQYSFAVRTYLLLVIVAGLIALPETLTGMKLVPGLGPPVGVDTGRFGLHRGNGGFDHPILFGAFSSTVLGLIWYLHSDRPTRWMVVALVTGVTFLALSSAPLLACMLAGAVIVWEKYTRTIANRVTITLSIIAAAYIVVGAFSNRSPIAVLLPFISLDPWTAYYRLYIWEYATMNIMEHPIFGIGLNDWVRPAWMPTSVDSLWLTIMLLGGVPTLVFLVIGIVLLMIRVHAQGADAETRERWKARFGWTAAVLALCMQAFTVHYWGAMHGVFFFVLGLGAWLTDAEGRETVKSTAKAQSRPRLVTARSRPIGRMHGRRV